jgi:cytochrome bd-type quinol oxidase subunit 2
MTAATKKSVIVKQGLRMLAGAVCGAVGVIAFMEAGGKASLDSDDPGVIVAIITGLSYALMGLAVGLGALAPRQGAVFLNVEDEEEIREQRQSLLPSAASCILIGVFLLILALAPVGGGGELTLWAAAAAACLVAMVAIALSMRKRTDELMRQISLESSALTLYVALTVLSVWGMLAHLGLAPWLTPLTLIAGLAALQLVLIFWVVQRKGLMAVR